MSLLDGVLSWLLTLALHATVLLALAWGLERLGALRHPGWRELAWRGALFGGLLSSLWVSFGGPAQTALAPVARVEMQSSGAGDAPAATATTDAAQAIRATLPGESGLGRLQSSRRTGAGADPSAPTMPAQASEPIHWHLPGPASAALFLAWALGLLPVALRFVAQGRALRRWMRQQPGRAPRPGSPMAGQAEHLALALGLTRSPSLWIADGLASPLLLPNGRLLVPAWAESLEPAQQQALLAHELAHLKRRDPAWRLVQRLAVLPLYFHPLAWLALRRLEALAEDACDQSAAALCGSGRPLAECLAACLARHPSNTTPTLAVAMAAEPGPVVRRVKNLLEETPMSRPIPTPLRRTALVVGLAAALALPGLAITSIGNTAQAGSLFDGLFNGTSHTRSNGKDHYVHRNGRTGERIEMTLRGDIGFSEAEDDIMRMAPDSEFELSIKRDGVERSLRVVPGPDGLQRDYRVDGKPAPFDAAARTWLAQALPHLMRETAIQAEARGKRFLARGGADALLEEIGKIEGDHARGKYLRVLFANARLDEAGMDRAVELAAGIGSDFELRRVLQAGIENQSLAPSAHARLLAAAKDIGSDYELAQLLKQLANAHMPEGAVLAAWSEALATIGSDYEQRRVLEALLARGEPAATRLALEAAATIGSDFEARQVLQKAAPNVHGDATARAAWFALLPGVGSDFEQRQALAALVAAGPVDTAIATDVIEAVAAIGSDHESLQVLLALAEAMPADPAVIERYRAASRRLSDHERGRAERALDRLTMAVVD